MAHDLALDEAACDRILAILDGVPDPEIPVVSIVDLGIVRAVRPAPAAVVITPTYSGCPATVAITASIRAALDEAGFANVGVESVLAPPWTTDWITERGRARLESYGIAPPRRDGQVACPRCGSADTQLVSQFGSTPCKALRRCLACHEPFDHFKCH